MDLCLSSFIKQKVFEATGHQIDELVPSVLDGDAEQDDLCLPASVHNKAEEVKKKLTFADTVDFSCRLPSGLGLDAAAREVKFPVSRTDFESQIFFSFLFFSFLKEYKFRNILSTNKYYSFLHNRQNATAIFAFV